jgi:hypothetical protein
MKAAIACALLLAPAAADAADRTYGLGSFERLRVEGPFEVRVETGRSPGAKASGDDKLLEELAIDSEGDTLVIRLGHGAWGETPAGKAAAAPVITLTTPLLRSVSVDAGGRVQVRRMAAQRLQLSVNGSGAIAVAAADADEVQATVIGAGQMTLAGHAQRVRLLTNGPGTIDAGALVANDLTVRLDGTGTTKANARYGAQVTTTGLGKVTVLGQARCVVHAQAGGPVACGVGG